MACPETIGTLITAGLARASNPGISTEALAFAKRLFQHWYNTKALRFNIASTSVTATSSGIDISALTTFRSVYLLKLTGIERPMLETIPYKDLWPMIQHASESSITGTPTHFATEINKQSLILYPRPAQTYTGTLKYYSAPSTASWTTATFPEYEDALAIETAIADWAMNYDKEPMGVLVTRLTEQLQAEYENHSEPVGHANQQTLRWGTNFNKMKGD